MSTATIAVTKQKRDGSTMPRTDARNRELAERNALIKARAKSGRYRQVDLAKEFGLSQGAISQIVRNPNAVYFTE